MATLLVLDGNGDAKYISYASGTGSSGDPLIPNDETRLASILAKLSADPSTETTLAAILAKIISAPATSAKQDSLAALIGEVQASPTSNTLLDRLKAIHADLTATLAVSGTLTAVTTVGTITNVVHVDDNAGSLTVDGTITANIGTVGTLATAAKQDTQITAEQAILAKIIAAPSTEAKQDTGNTSVASIDTKTPALGQALAAASTPVVLTAAQITTLTPPAAITGFATETTLAAQSAKLPATLGQTTKANSLSVALASNQDALPITDNSGSLTVDNAGTFAVQAAQSGTWTVQPGNTANTTAWKVDGSAVTQPVSSATFATVAKQPALGTAGSASTDVITVQGIASGTNLPTTQTPATSGGLTIYKNLDIDETGVNVKASAGQLFGWYVFNAAASTRYVKLYNKASAATVGTDTPVFTLGIPAGAAANVEYANGIAFATGIALGCTTGVADNSTGAPATNDVVITLLYK